MADWCECQDAQVRHVTVNSRSAPTLRILPKLEVSHEILGSLATNLLMV
jgi:hypothetical protein